MLGMSPLKLIMGWQKHALGFIILVLFIRTMAELQRVSRMFEIPTIIITSPLTPIEQGKSIRRWGCHRTETPFIFVHIAKAGGGTNRRRFAAAARGYDRAEKWWVGKLDDHHYPVRDSDHPDGMRRAKFCNSENKNFQIPYGINGTMVGRSFEGTKPCNATTPIGHAIGCPAVQKCLGCRDANSELCDTVYVGHNWLGNEMHWLPPKYLQRWWLENWSAKASEGVERIHRGFDSIATQGRHQWCPKYDLSRPDDVFSKENIDNTILMECSNLASRRADSDLKQLWGSMARPNDYSPLYASLPLHRVTMIREPFSWLKSRFYWDHHYKNFVCDDIQSAGRQDKGWDKEGWAYGALKNYTLQLCGEDCHSRIDTGAMTLEDAVYQAESNLRNSFSVVGLLNETESFYDMIETRISYMNMSLEVHPAVMEDARHASGHGKSKTEYARCSKAFIDSAFQQRFREEIPLMVSLEHLYEVGVEVNRFQKEELHQCR